MSVTDWDKIKAIVLDVDGTLLDTAWVYRAAWADVARRYGYTGQKLQRLMQNFDALLHSSPELTPVESFIQIFATTATTAWLKAQRDEVVLRLVEQIKPLANAKQIIAQLLAHQEARNIILITGSTQRVFFAKVAAQLWLTPLKESAITIDHPHMHQSKPAPDLFVSAAEALGLPPEVCLAIDDEAVGLSAAKQAGMPAVDSLTKLTPSLL